MAYASKSEQRLQLSKNYSGGKSTLNSTSYRKTGDMGSNGSRKAIGGLMASKSDGSKLYGKTGSGTGSSIGGTMSDEGFPDAPRWKRETEPGNLQPGKPSQASNTTRIKPESGKKSAVMHVTSSAPKSLKGGK